MLKTILRLSLILGITLIISCDKETDEPIVFIPEATFSVAINDETMPVWVHGKETSPYLILAVHGGPGSDVLDFRTYKGGDGFRTLENDFQIAYWQQRASGQSVGSDKNSLFTIDNYVNDADAVIDELLVRYPDKKIVLFGHSWGGMLTAAYLQDDARRSKIIAWINAAGVHNGTTLFDATIEDINTVADMRIDANENVSYWEKVKADLKANPDLANALAYAVVDEIPEVPVKVDNSDFEFTNRASKSNTALFSEIIASDFTSSLADFKLPVLILWGEYDFAVSKTLRQEVLDNIGSDQVTSITFPASGHYMMFHEPALFASSVKSFVDGL